VSRYIASPVAPRPKTTSGITVVGCRRKWGISVSPGSSRKAGNVMRLKMENTTVNPSAALDSHAASY
jgi:hypothetical protein